MTDSNTWAEQKAQEIVFMWQTRCQDLQSFNFEDLEEQFAAALLEARRLGDKEYMQGATVLTQATCDIVKQFEARIKLLEAECRAARELVSGMIEMGDTRWDGWATGGTWKRDLLRQYDACREATGALE